MYWICSTHMNNSLKALSHVIGNNICIYYITTSGGQAFTAHCSHYESYKRIHSPKRWTVISLRLDVT